MKKIYLLLAAAFVTAGVYAQNTFPATGAVGIGTTAPNASSLLEVKSTTKGVLISRMSKKSRNLISSPATGLLIYQTDSLPGFYYYSGTVWLAVTSGSTTETDPQVGTIATGKIPRWDGSALSTGAISDNGDYIAVGLGTDSKYRVNSRTTGLQELEVVGKSAVRGEANGWSGFTNNIFATGYLGVKKPSGIYSVITDGFSNNELGYIGVFGVKEYDTIQGAGVYGWTRGGADNNYGTMGVSTSNIGNNYGLHGRAIGNGGFNTGVFGKAEDGNANFGVYGTAVTTSGQFGYGVYASATGSGTNYAGYFVGNVRVLNDGEALTIAGTNPYIQVKNGANNIGYLQGYNSDYILATNSENNGNLVFGTKAFNRMYISSGGKISINNSAITAQLNIKGDNEAVNINGADPYIQFNNGTTTKVGYVRALNTDMLFSLNNSNTTGKIKFLTDNKPRMWIDVNGNVSISDDGKIASGYLFNVKGKMIAEEMMVELNGNWPDYVFSKDYKLMSLSELKQYITENNHLPQLPSAETMKDGIALGEMNKMLTEKVEQLTLYILQMHDEIEALKKQNK